MLAAGDTFRAAAIDQLEIWARRTNTELVKHQEGSDPASVVFDAIKAAKARHADYVIADTAGRLHTRHESHGRTEKNSPHHRTRTRDAPPTKLCSSLTPPPDRTPSVRRNSFPAVVPLTGIALAKLDGTARGGIVITLADELKIPIKLIGVGEKPDDLELI